MENNEAVVLFDTIDTQDGHVIASMTLNDPKALNALSVDMCKLMSERLTAWQNDEKIVAILLKGSGEKAFCAGGNIRKLYDSMVENPACAENKTPNPYATEFFGYEYGLYRQMHFYQKPIILWGNGIVMGGGLGLTAMCSHRIVTETTRIAMPEITIGLYPDATGSWFLPRMPAKTGLFLGLTGANCNGADALLVNLAEFAVASQEYDKVINALQQADWQQQKSAKDIVSHAFSQIHHTEHLPESQIAKHWLEIQQIVNQGDVFDIDTALRNPALAEKYADDKWFSKALETYQHGCPVSACLTVEAFKRATKLSLEQTLYMEANVSLNCANNPDFKEGVRALLIDKDKSPKWSRTLQQCDDAYINSHFDNLFETGKHPFDSWLNDDAWSVKLAKNYQ